MTFKTFLTELRRRRVAQVLGIYLGASWATIQFVDWLVGRYLLSPAWTDAVLIALVSLAPAVAILAWEHGAAGRQAWGRAGRFGVPLNLLVTVALLGVFLSSRDLSAAAKAVTVTDEDGQEITRMVPTAAARRKVALFFWRAESGDPELAWLRYGLPLLLDRDLSQNPFVAVTTPYDGYRFPLFARLRRAGYDDGLDVPLALQRRLAAQWHLDHFAEGRVERHGDGLRATLTVYATDSAEEVARHVVEAAEPTALVDELSRLLIADLDVPAGGARLAPDLPVAEHTSGDLAALRAWVEGKTERMIDNDAPAAIAALRRAVEIDPAFALAYNELANVLFDAGDSAAAAEAADRALRHDYKLTERDRFMAKAQKYFIDEQFDKRLALYEMWADLHPDDVIALGALANAYLWQGNRVEKALEVYEHIAETFPGESWALREIADLAVLQGRADYAIERLEAYAAMHPDEHAVLIDLGIVHRTSGDLDAAREAFERAALMASGFVSPTLELADLALRRGDVEGARERLDEADRIAVDAQQKALVLRYRVEQRKRRGEIAAAYALLEPSRTLELSYQPPIEVAMAIDVTNTEIFVTAGRAEELRRRIDAWVAQLGPPFDDFLEVGYMLLALAEGDLETCARRRESVAQTVERWQRDDLDHWLEMTRCIELRLGGSPAAAIEPCEKALELFARSVQSQGQDLVRVDILYELAAALRQAGRPNDALARLDQIQTLFPAEPRAALERARIAVARRRPDDARRHLEAALDFWRDADPDYQPAANARALLTEL